MTSSAARVALLVIVTSIALSGQVCASAPIIFKQSEIDAAFNGAQRIDLATSTVSSVVKLRDEVGIPPPPATVLVKTFERDSLPPVLQGAFVRPGIVGVTVNGRYIAILHTELENEYQDVLRHELVHAYITMAAPNELPFWFQEASAVHFSTDKTRKFYGQPAKDKPGVMVGRTLELDETYKQKLQSFHFLIGQVGKERFYEWYKQAVETGVVDARPLLGLKPEEEAGPGPSKRTFPLWLAAVIGGAVVVVAIAGYYSMKRSEDFS